MKFPFEPSLIEEGISYEAYQQLVGELVEAGKSSGPKQSEALIGYTALNFRRSNRIQKVESLDEQTIDALKAVDENWIWLVLTESWCGDAAQVLPYLAKMAALNPKIRLSLLFRDEHHPVIDTYLTNGGRSIPKLICIRESDWEVLGTWGPRPEPAQVLHRAFKADPDKDYDTFNRELQLWYTKDHGKHIQLELRDAIRQWMQ